VFSKKTAQAIVNVFETSRLLGDYSRLALLAGAPGLIESGTRTLRQRMPEEWTERAKALGFSRAFVRI